MSSTASYSSKILVAGTYSAAKPTDLRSPCPLVNCLANHGYIPRDGRTVYAKDLIAGMKQVGVSSALGAALAYPVFSERLKQNDETKPPRSLWDKISHLARHLWAIVFPSLGVREPEQIDSNGNFYINLDQLALHGVMEHDISLTRMDYNQGNNTSLQPKLLKDLLAASSDHGKTLTDEDFAAFRRRRTQQQRQDNPRLVYGPRQHDTACLSIAMILSVFGDGKKVPCEYVRPFFSEERLPIHEGWRKRRWWSLGFLELGWGIRKVKRIIGLRY